jgi:hypothetical protein
MNFKKPLAPNTKYIVTVPKTVTNADGVALSKEFTGEFTTGEGSDKAEMGIVAASVKSISEIVNGSKIQIRTKYANLTDEEESCLMIVAYYNENNALLGTSFVKGSLEANSIDMNMVAPFNVPSESQLDLSKVKRVSVFLWDSYQNIVPYCEQLNIF